MPGAENLNHEHKQQDDSRTTFNSRADGSERFREQLYSFPSFELQKSLKEKQDEREQDRVIADILSELLNTDKGNSLAELYGHKNNMDRLDYSSAEIVARRERVEKLFAQAHASGMSEELTKKINAQLESSNSPYRFSITATQLEEYVSGPACDPLPGGSGCPDRGFTYSYTRWNVMLHNTSTKETFDTAEFSNHLHSRWR